MLRKEFHEVLKQSLFYLAVVLAIPLAITLIYKEVDSYFDSLFVMLQFSMLLFSGFMGVSLFLSDKNQGAEDYMLSLPYSRLRLAAMKLLPRLAVSAVIYLFFVVLYLWYGRSVILDYGFISTSVFYWLLFFFGVSFSAASDGYMKTIGFALLGLLSMVLLVFLLPKAVILLKGGSPSIFPFKMDAIPIPHLSLSVFLLLPLPYFISFILAFKKWGYYSKANYNREYFKFFIPIMAVVFVVSTVILSILAGAENKQNYYLTSKNYLLKTDFYSAKLMAEGGEVKLRYPHGSIRPIYDDVKYTYFTDSGRDNEYLKLLRIDQDKFEVEMLYEKQTTLQPNWFYKNNIYFFETKIVVHENTDDSQLSAFVFIDTESKAIKRIQTRNILPGNYHNPHIFGANRAPGSGKISWLIYSEWSDRYPLLKMWEDGKIEDLGILSGSWPYYINGILIYTFEKEIILGKIGEKGFEILQKAPLEKGIDFSAARVYRYSRFDFNPISTKEIIFSKTRYEKKDIRIEYSRFDMETLQFIPIDRLTGKRSLNLLVTPSGAVYGIESRREGDITKTQDTRRYLDKIYRIEGEKVTLIKEFPKSKVMQPGDDFWLSSYGAVLKQDNQVSVYAFPDLNELKFN